MTVPAVGTHIEIYRSSETNITIYNSNTDKTFLIGEKESRVLALLDGTLTLGELQNKCPFYSEDDLSKLIDAFDQIGVFRKERRKLNPFKIKLRLFNPNDLFHGKGSVTVLLSDLIFWGGPLLLFAGILLNAYRVFTGNLLHSPGEIANAFYAFGISDYAILLVGAIVSLFLHELAHAVTARNYDVNVPEIGIMLYYFIPCAYTNVSGINLLRSRKKRIAVLASGTFVNIGIIGLCYILLHIFADVHISAILSGLILLNLATVFMNGMVFLKFDGYYILEVLVGECQLRETAIGCLLNALRKIVPANKTTGAGTEAILPASGSPLNNLTYCIYAATSLAYVPFVLINTLVSLIHYF